MKNYNAEVYISFGHGKHGASYHGLTTMEITANNKKDAKEIAKRFLEDYEWEEGGITHKASWYNLTIDITEIK